jgi:hypothetical protein
MPKKNRFWQSHVMPVASGQESVTQLDASDVERTSVPGAASLVAVSLVAASLVAVSLGAESLPAVSPPAVSPVVAVSDFALPVSVDVLLVLEQPKTKPVQSERDKRAGWEKIIRVMFKDSYG